MAVDPERFTELVNALQSALLVASRTKRTHGVLLAMSPRAPGWNVPRQRRCNFDGTPTAGTADIPLRSFFAYVGISSSVGGDSAERCP
jgi:hypothetical protein